ncbi:MAG TPA: HlyC/CorC family transporter [Dongiaceae bacterium]|jgi:Mg2+/Co2+ transporter CorB|nr:HlyC/CorC family transporter [Dongiaceae bacterium]
MTDIDLSIVIIAALILLSAFFALSETALTAASRARMHAMAEEGDRRATLVNRLREHMEHVISTLLLGNNFVNILASAIATDVLVANFGARGVFYATGGMTALVIIFAEVLPKTYAINDPDRAARAVAPVVRLVIYLLYPITRLIHWLVTGCLRLFGVRTDRDLGAEQSLLELRGAIDLHAEHTDDIAEAGQMLHSILDLDDVPVSDIMVHRQQVRMIDETLPTAEIVREVLSSPYTRLPLYRGNGENITGILHVKDLLRAVQANTWNIAGLEIRTLAASPWFVPESTPLLDQLRAFRARREHFALVVDEYGAFQGIVTLEDILEEIVGDITDEHDVKVAGVTANADGSYDIDGTVTLRDLNRELGWRLPDEAASTIAGLVLDQARLIPVPGQIFVFFGFRFEILERRRNQLTRLRVTPPGEGSNAAAH